MEPISPTLDDAIAARPHVYRHVRATPLYPAPGLSKLLSADVWVKHENHLPVGAFKVRGGLHLAATLAPGEGGGIGRTAPSALFTASTGNHGQSIAFAGRAYGIPVTIAVPRGANPLKVAAMEALGAKVVAHGADFDEAREWIMTRAQEESARFVGPTDPELIAGVASYALEILEELPEVEDILVPVGAGSGACGCCIAGRGIRPALRVFGVQSEQAPTQQRSWREGRPVLAAMETRAEGLATRVPFDNTQRILRDDKVGLEDFMLVSDDELENAIRLFFEHTRNLAEHAGAAALAGALRIRDQLRDRKVVLVLSGGNLSIADLRRIFAG